MNLRMDAFSMIGRFRNGITSRVKHEIEGFKNDSKLGKGLTVVPLALLTGLSALMVVPGLDMRWKGRVLDKNPSLVFKSVADCEAQGFDPESCHASFQSAAAYLDHPKVGPRWHFMSRAGCEEDHGRCVGHTHVSYFNGIRTYDDYYTPLVKAWQALERDLSVAVPLVSSPEEGTLVRWDGREFRMDLGQP